MTKQSDKRKYPPEISNLVASIAHPLFKNFDFTYFSYNKQFLKEKKSLVLCSNVNWINSYFSSTFKNRFIYEYVDLEATEFSERRFYWPPSEEKNNDMLKALHENEIWHCYGIYRRKKDILESWHFGTDKDNFEVINIYLNHLEILHSFILYFFSKIQECDIDYDRITFSYENYNVQKSPDRAFREKYKNFVDQTKIINFWFNLPSGEKISLTRREMECLQLLASGKSIKEIALRLKFSPRTTEFHLNNIKIKAKTHTKSQLIELFYASPYCFNVKKENSSSY